MELPVIYIITANTGDQYDNWTSHLGFVTSEKVAKEIVANLNASRPTNPFNDPDEQLRFEDAIYDWSEIENDRYDEEWAKEPAEIYDECSVPFVKDAGAHQKFMDDVNKLIKAERRAWFERNHPQWADKLDAWDEWQDYTGYETDYSYEEMKAYGHTN